MLALCHVLVTEGLHDEAFLARCCHGAERFIAYVRGESDGIAKTPEWAAERSRAPRGRSPRARAPDGRVADARHGVVLAAARGARRAAGLGRARARRAARPDRPPRRRLRPRLRLDGRPRQRERRDPAPDAARGTQPVSSFIPVARIADLLLQPGESFDYNGARHVYPDIRLVYWAGGNPFHHHQDLNRLRSRPRPARHGHRARALLDADGAPRGPRLPGDDLLRAQRHRLGPRRRADHRDASRGRAGRRGAQRPRHPRRAGRALRRGEGLHRGSRRARLARGAVREDPRGARRRGHRGAGLRRVLGARARSRSRTSRRSACSSTPSAPIPRRNRLRTPSGKIELFSETIAGFGYDDCPGHPSWIEKQEWLGSPRARRFPLALVANNPATRLHGQLDHGAYSQAAKVKGREPVRMHPTDAAARGIADGDVVRLVERPRELPRRRRRDGGRAAPAWCSSRRAPGSIPTIRAPRSRCACTATRTC